VDAFGRSERGEQIEIEQAGAGGFEEDQHVIGEVSVADRRNTEAGEAAVGFRPAQDSLGMGAAGGEPVPVSRVEDDRFAGGDGFDEVGHEVDVGARCEGEEVLQVGGGPGAAGEPRQPRFELGDEFLVEESQAGSVVLGQIARGEFRGGLGVGAGDGGVADREEGAEAFEVFAR
jgi:hypothetical protein